MNAYAQQMPETAAASIVAVEPKSLADQIAEKQASIKEAKAVIDGKSISQTTQWWSNSNAMTMSAAVLLFGALVIAMVSNQIKNHEINDRESKMFIVVLVIVSALFVVVAGYSDSQMAPVMGLLGTIVGYVLGQRSTDNQQPPQPPVEPRGVQGPAA